MNDVPRDTLRELIARHGPGLLSDAKRCEGLLRDLCGAHRREINTLISALKERVPLDLLAAQSTIPRGLLLARLTRRLEDQLALTEGAARWAVDSWALALGVVTDAEVEEREKEFNKPAATLSPPAASRPIAEEDADEKSPSELPAATRPATPPRRQPSGRPSAPATTPVSRPTNTQSASPASAPPAPASRPSVAVPSTSAGAQSNAPLSTSTIQLPPQVTSQDPPARRRGGTWRGCLVGCFLLLLLSLALFLGVPFVVSVLREEQQQRSLEPPPVRSH